MNTDDDTLATAATVSSEIEGRLLMNSLHEHGIAATVTGTYTSQFQVGVPGLVRVMVKQSELAEAKAVLAQQAEAPPADFDDPNDTHAEHDVVERNASGFDRLVWLVGQALAITAAVIYVVLGGSIMLAIAALGLFTVVLLSVVRQRSAGKHQ